MTRPCTEFQHRLLAHFDQSEPADAQLSRHLAACSACAAVAKRYARAARAMRDLTRLGVPAELSGRVVSACNAGYREDRAVAMVKRLPRGGVPAELDEKMLRDTTVFGSSDEVHGEAHLGLARTKPSEVLDRLVEEDLRNPAQAAVRRFASRLGRVSAPSELRARVDRLLRARIHPIAVPALATRRMVAAAAVLAVGFVTVFVWLEQARRPASKFSFEVERVTDMASMDPMVRSLVSGLSGGLVNTSKSSGKER